MKDFIFKIAQKIADWLGIPMDKVLHFAAGFTIALIGALIWDNEIGFALAILAGISKEIYDQFKYGGFDWKDLLVTILGGLIIYLTL